MITRILVANRAEIAQRVFRTCRDLGIETVAVFSEADRDLPFVREADTAVCVGEGPSATSYLDVNAILAAARRSGADAIHPGYGFLSENADFADAVTQAGLTWIGPPASAIRAMGDKAAARQLAARHDVPTVPGFDGEAQDLETLTAEAERIGYPILVKASAGGGGRGMRRVESSEGLGEAVASAKREAASAFGSDRVLLEHYVERPRHLEIQVFGDQHGNVVHLHERECSIQRRHQKIVEEAPSVALSQSMRDDMGAAACRLAAAVGYEGAGTVEFLLGPDGRWFFLEMNTRLQVEHPVTECITGQDLVAWQIRVAEGGSLPLAQGDIPLNGHAIEVRLVAEDPMRDWMPSTGRIHRLELAEEKGLRNDIGFESGSTIPMHYDSMIGKLIAWGPDRSAATRRLLRAVRQAWMPGPASNLSLLRDILASEAWGSGDLETAFLQREGLPEPPPLNLHDGALAAVVHLLHQEVWGHYIAPSFRLWGPERTTDQWTSFGELISVSWCATGPRHASIHITASGLTFEHDVELLEVDGTITRCRVDASVRTWRSLTIDATTYVHLGHGEAMLSLLPRHPLPSAAEDDPGTCASPTPGTVVKILVGVGDAITAGQTLAVVEAMKMEHPITAPADGVVQAIYADIGDTVDEGQVLVRLEDDEEA